MNAGVFERARRLLASPVAHCAAAFPWEQGLLSVEYVGSVLVVVRPLPPAPAWNEFQANWRPGMGRRELVSLPAQEFEFGEGCRVCVYGDAEVVALLLTDFWRFMRLVEMVRQWAADAGALLRG